MTLRIDDIHLPVVCTVHATVRLDELPLVILEVSISCWNNTKLIRVSQMIEPLQLKEEEQEEVTSPSEASQQA